MAEAAGTVKIRVTSDTKELSALQAELKKSLTEIASLRAEIAKLKTEQEQAAAAQKAQASSTRTAAAADKARAAELKELQAEYDATLAKIQELEAQAEEYLNLGLSSDADPHVDEIYEQEAELADELDAIHGKMVDLEAEGTAAHEAIAQSAREAAEAEAEVAQSTGTTTDAIKTFSKGAGAFVRSSSSIKGGIRTMGTALNSTAGMIGLAAGVTVLAAKTIGDALSDCYDEGMQFLGEIADGFAEVASSAADATMDAIGDAADSAADAVGDLAGEVSGLASSLASSGVNELMDAFNGQLDEAQDACLLAGNAVNSFEESLTNVGDALVSAFSPIIDVVVPYINTLVEALADVINTLGMLFAALSGSTTYTKLVSSGLDSVSGSADDASSSLAGFDELDVLDQDSGSSGSSSGSGLTTETVAIDDDILAIAEDFWGWLEDFDAEQFGYDLAQAIADALNSINWEEIQEAAALLGTKLAELLNGVFSNLELAEAIGTTIAEALNTALIFAYNFITTFDFYQFGTWIGTALNAAVEAFDWELLGDTVAAGLNGIVDAIKGFIETTDWYALANGIATSISNALTGIDWVNLANTVLAGMDAITQAIWGFIDGIQWAEIAADIITGIQTLVDGMYMDENGELHDVWEENGEAVGALMDELVETVLYIVENFPYTELADRLCDWLIASLEGINWEDVGKTVNELLTGILDFIDEFLSNEETQQAITTAISDLIKGLDVEEIAEKLSGVISEAADYVAEVGDESGAFETIGEVMMDAMILGAQLKWEEFRLQFGVWSTLFCNDVTGTAEGLSSDMQTISEDATASISEEQVEDWTSMAETICSTVSGAFETIMTSYGTTETNMQTTSDQMSASQQQVWSDICATVGSAASSIWSSISGTWDSVLESQTTTENLMFESLQTETEAWNELISGFLADISEWWDDTWTDICDFAGEVWGNIYEDISTKMTDIDDTISEIMAELGPEWEEAWEGVKTTTKNIINGIIGFINDLIGGVETMINAVITAINSISIDLPEIMGGGHIGFNLTAVSLTRVPELASGAVIRGGDPFAAILGDQPAGQTNIETPLDTMVEAFRTALDDYGSTGGINTVVLQVNGEDIAHATLDDYISEINRRGVSVQTVIQGA